ncbi:MAG TPA: aminodeoxychorismate synthase component I [Ignavibacteriaceae bacterium]|nr:aminodeoxychorismate synthase component I [Ignavibacteriaceae bacterium]
MNFNDIIKQVESNPYSAFFYTPAIYTGARSYIFTEPCEIINVYGLNDLQKTFNLVDKFIKKGLLGYCLINYEAGYLIEKKLEKFSDDDQKVMQFFFFKEKNVDIIKSSKIIFSDNADEKSFIKNFRLNTTIQQFGQNIRKIKKYIKAGDTYQVNYTLKGKFTYSGSCSALFQRLLFNQTAKYSAFINNDDNFILSLSPELFFRIKKNTIVSQPMKGTIGRGVDQSSDALNEIELVGNEKNKAENVMIVDLIRNDLGRICRPGSISVSELFKTEKYESLFQMISTIEGKLNKKIRLTDVIKNVFPCGSVTGAPKIRTMEIIQELEKESRGIYTGSIGLFTKKEIVFNVAIRTLTINKTTRNGEIGIGAGIVWDSDPELEFNESNLKSKFLNESAEYFELLETMLLDNGQIEFQEDHLTRMKSAADYFLFNFNEKKMRKRLLEQVENSDKSKKYKLRLTLNKWGKLSVSITEVKPIPDEIEVIVSEKRINSLNRFQHFKTTNRRLYDEEYSKYSSKGFFEVIYQNEKDEVTEGSRTNIFIRKGSEWFTPSLTSGALPGIYRNHFLHKEKVKESILSLEDILSADEVWLTNSIIKEVKVDHILLNDENH